MILGLTGPIASGKGEAAKYFQQKGFSYFTISDAIKEELIKRNLALERTNYQDIGNIIREKEGAGAWVKRISQKMIPNKDYIIDGIRNPGEIEELKKMKGILISIESSDESRFKRLLERGRPLDPKTKEEFAVLNKRDLGEDNSAGQQVKLCMESADIHITNNSTMDEFHKELDLLHQKISSQYSSLF